MRRVHKEIQPSADIRAGTAYELPVEDSSVDAIICAQVLHTKNQRQWINERHSIGSQMQTPLKNLPAP